MESKAKLGSKIRIQIRGELKDFKLVDQSLVNPDEGQISLNSPVGKALLGHKSGERIIIKTPQNILEAQICEIQ